MKPLKENRKILINRLEKVFETVKSLPFVNKAKISAIGYCFGGFCVLDMARANFGLKGCVSFHSSFTPPDYQTPDKIECKVLALHGDNDHMPVEQIRDLEKEIRDKKADWQLHIYGGAQHGFAHKGAQIRC